MAALTPVDQDGCTALHYCATNRRTLVIDLLLGHWLETGSEARSLLEISDCEGLTILAHAVIAGNQTIVEHLLSLGADVSCHDNERHTVMHLATGQNCFLPCMSTEEHLGLLLFFKIIVDLFLRHGVQILKLFRDIRHFVSVIFCINS